MFTDRRKKLALAAAILLVGIGAALYFRLDDPDETAAAQLPMPGPTASPIASPTSDSAIGQEPKLTGHIEPFNAQPSPPGDSRASQLDPPAFRDTAATRPPFDAATNPTEAHLLKAPPLTTASDTSPGSIIFASEPSGSTLKWQTVPRPAAAAPMSVADSPSEGDPRAIGIAAPARRHRIVDGDTLAQLAHRYFGAESRRLDLFEFNRDVLASPDLLPIGKELRIPPASYVRPTSPSDELKSSPSMSRLAPISTTVSAAHPTSSAQYNVVSPSTAAPLVPNQTYVVQPHDTLPLIARKLYGDIARQREILAANAGQLHSAADLRAGMTLAVPARTDGRR